MSATIESITNTILVKLKEGTVPWTRPYAVVTPYPLRANGVVYRGFNILWLWMVAEERGYSSPYWMTYKQAQTLGGQVRKGEKASLSYFYKPVFEDEDEEIIKTWILKTYRVFNADQIDGLEDTFYPEQAAICETERTAAIDAFFAAIPAHVRHGGSQAYYDRTRDEIVLPPRAAFHDDDLYATTRFHETLHWTGSADRLNRTFGKRFGDEAYAFEELVACLGQALIGAQLGLPTSHLDNHAAYVASWIKVLETDKRALLSAAKHAERAVEYVMAYTAREDAPLDQCDTQEGRAA